MAVEKTIVVVIGGGIGGQVAAIALARSGRFHVTMIEAKAQYLESNSAGGLGLTHNGVRNLQALGMAKGIDAIADQVGGLMIRRHSDGATLEALGSPHVRHFVHRTDLLHLLHRTALDVGVEILTGETVRSINETDDSVAVVLNGSGRRIDAAIVIGADGMNSKTRAVVSPVRSQLTGECTWLADIPKEVMDMYPKTSELYNELGSKYFQYWVGPKRGIIGWTMRKRGVFHLQINDHGFGFENPNEPYVTRYGPDQMPELRKRWADFEEAVSQMLAHTTDSWKWRIAEVPEIPTWSSAGHRVVLVGDAAHAFPPFAGQGANMAIEDGAVLGSLLARIPEPSKAAIGRAVEAYEKVRKPRVERMREIVNANPSFFLPEDQTAMSERDRVIAHEAQEFSAETHQDNSLSNAVWIETYDAVGAANELPI